MATKTYVVDVETTCCGQNIEDNIKRFKSEGLALQDAKLQGVEEYAIECAILKVFLEVVQYTSDAAVQIYGGMGFSAELSRGMLQGCEISRIYEGTNEFDY